MAERRQAGSRRGPRLAERGLLIDARRVFRPDSREGKSEAPRLQLVEPRREGEFPSAA